MPSLGEVALARSTSESAQTVALRADTKKPGASPGFNVWWWSLALHRTSLNNACGLLRKHAELCGLALLFQPFM